MTADVWLGTPEAERHFDPQLLSEADRKRYSTLRGSRHRQEFAVSRALRAAVLGVPTSCTSLSHSGGWAAVAAGPQECRVGVDIEFHRPRDVLSIARFAFDPSEIAALEALSGSPQTSVFYALWTAKESMAKALGAPLLVACRQCVFEPGTSGWRGTAPTSLSWQLQVFQPRADLTLSLVIIGADAGQGIATHEWPAATATAWDSVASLHVGTG